MGVYVDIDMDYLVKPVNKVGTNSIRTYKNNYCIVDNVEYFVNNLVKNGFLGCNERKFFTNHRKSYTYWWIKKSMNNTLIHIDAHSDLYGNKNRNLNLLSDLDMACDNYVWYGIRDGFISQIYWVVPEGLYDLSEINIAERFVSKDLLVHYEYIGDRLEMSMSLITRSGEKTINYTICAMDKLPSLSGIELVTVATSPEFTPESSDLEIFRALKLLGASEEDMNRIKKFHEEMMAG